MPNGKTDLLHYFCDGDTLIIDIGKARARLETLAMLEGVYTTRPFESLYEASDERELKEIRRFKDVVFYSHERYSDNRISVGKISSYLDGWSNVTFMFNSL